MINAHRILPLSLLFAVALVVGCGGGGGGATTTGRTSTATTSTSTTATTSTTTTGTNGIGTRSKWTVMVFLNAANDLYPYAVQDMNEMEQIATNSDVRFVVQWKQVQGVGGNLDPLFSSTRRYLVKNDNTNAIASDVVEDIGVSADMGQPQTVSEFVSWTKTNFPADRYALIVWNHGNGWQRSPNQAPKHRAISYDDHTGNTIEIWQLPVALRNNNVSILSFDACLMQMLEVATEVQDFAELIAASEENTPGQGYPYNRVFQPFMANPSASTRELSRAFVDGHVGNPGYANDTITQSVLDTTKIPAVVTAVDGLAGALIANVGQLTQIAPQVRASSPKYAFRNDGRFYYDLFDIADRLQNAAGSPATVQTAAQAVKTAVTQAVIWNGHTALSAGSRGIAIDFSAGADFNVNKYLLLRLSRETRWDDWLKIAP